MENQSNEYNERILIRIGAAYAERILDSRNYPVDRVWTIGRALPTDLDKRQTHIQIRDPYVSKLHALLRYNEEDLVWEIKHMGRQSKTAFNKKILKPGSWYPIIEDSIAYFGRRDEKTQIIFTYQIDITLHPSEDDQLDTVPLIEPSRPKESQEEQQAVVQVASAPAPAATSEIWYVHLIHVLVDFFQDTTIVRLLIFLLFLLAAFALVILFKT